jgi:uncharacterized membrane protein
MSTLPIAPGSGGTIMLPIPKLYVLFVVAAVLLVGDVLWLGWIASPMYQQLRQLLNPGIPVGLLPYKIVPAIAAYFVMALSIATLAVPMVPNTSIITRRLLASILWGGMWGLAVYGTYDFTNMATIEAYPAMTGLTDLMWGIILGISATFFGSLVV